MLIYCRSIKEFLEFKRLHKQSYSKYGKTLLITLIVSKKSI